MGPTTSNQGEKLLKGKTAKVLEKCSVMTRIIFS